MASGFKVITPKTAAQKQKLQNLPAGNVTMIKKGKKTYYVFPDPAHNQAYVGGPKEYRAYQQLRADKKLAREDLQDAEMYQDATMEWSMWEGGEGVWGPMGGPATVLEQPTHVTAPERPGSSDTRNSAGAFLPLWRGTSSL